LLLTGLPCPGITIDESVVTVRLASVASSTKTGPCPLGPIHCWTDTLCRLGMLPMLTLIKRRVTVKKIALLLLAGVSLVSTNVAAQETNTPASKVTKIFDRELPNVPGKSMRAVLVEYGPDAASPSHHHPSSAFIYATVLEGEIRSQVNDQPEHVYKAGESWTEMPGDPS
jgi:quercetin dioxygenase-like cupin family protein